MQAVIDVPRSMGNESESNSGSRIKELVTCNSLKPTNN